MKKYFYSLLAFAAFTTTAQTEIEPFAPAVPGTYLGDFEGYNSGDDIPANSIFTWEGDTGGTNQFIADDGTTLANLPGNVGDWAVGSVELGESITLISPEMDFGTYIVNPTLDLRYLIDNGAAGGFPGAAGDCNIEIMYKTSAGGSWNTLTTYTTVDFTWHDETIDLSGAGSYATYYLGFRFYTVTPGSFYTLGFGAIDEIVVTGTDNTGCSNSMSAFTVDACMDYTVPSGDETYTTAGTYMDTILNVAGCDSIMTITVNVTTPDVAVSTTANVITAAATGVTYQWIDCSDNSIIAGATAQTYTPTANGDYAVIITENACSDTSVCEAIVDLGLSDNELGLEVYPNPTKSFLNVTISNPEITEIQIWTMEGKLIQSVKVTAMGNLQLDLSTTENGTYLMQPVNGSTQLKPTLIVKN